jgi:hypothetical protein
LIEKYPDKNWCWGQYGISSNPNLTLEWIEKYPDKEWDWGYQGISSNPNFTIKWIEKYPNKPWYWGGGGISSNPNLTNGLKNIQIKIGIGEFVVYLLIQILH